MNSTPLYTWLLAGALLASLGWNVAGTRQTPESAPATRAGEPAAGAAGSTSVCVDRGCSLSAELELDLEPDEVAALSAACETSCNEAEVLDAEAERALELLWHRVADPEVGKAEIEELLVEVLELRERSLRTCVESALGLRDALPADQAERLFEHCCAPVSGDGRE